jgi:(2Fe-2S) ferredoxin
MVRDSYLFVCVNRRPADHPKGSCADKGSENVLAALKEALARRGLAKERARACGVSCLDMCGHGVAVLVEPAHVVYGGVRAEHADAIADALLRGEVVDALVVGSTNRGVDEPR